MDVSMWYASMLILVLAIPMITGDTCRTVYGPKWVELDPAVSTSCYFIGGKSKTFKQAKAKCEKKGAMLARIETHEENQMLWEYTKGTSENKWIGMTLNHTAKLNSWLDTPDEQAIYTNWAEGQPDDHTGKEYCAMMLKSDGSWNDANCDKTVKYICEKPLSCNDYGKKLKKKWETLDLSVSMSCYHFCEKDSSYYNAKQTCADVGGSMVSIESHEENNMLWKKMKEGGNRWIGMRVDHTSVPPTVWWTKNPTAEVTYTNWNPGEPDNHRGGGENCVQIMKRNGKWNDIPCDKTIKCLCEI
ncbi:hypothetical protein ScPMuIL_013207 [Solemya velum]